MELSAGAYDLQYEIRLQLRSMVVSLTPPQLKSGITESGYFATPDLRYLDV